MFSAPKLSRELNKLLQWETYNPLQNWIKMVLQSSKLRFTRSGSDVVEKHVQANN